MELFSLHGNSMVSQFADSRTRGLDNRKLVKLTGIVKLSKFYIGPPI